MAKYLLSGLALALWLAQPSVMAKEHATIIVEGPEVSLTVADFKKIYRTLPGEIKGGYLHDPQNVNRLVTSTYVTKVAAHRAEQAGLDQDPDVAAELWHRRINRLASAAIEAEIERQGAIDLKAATREYYLAHPEEYREPEKRICSHIVLDLKDNDAQQQAAAVRERLLNGELSFAEAVTEYSQEPGAAEKAGRLPPFEKGDMAPPFERAAFALSEPGELSPVVKTQFGYHLIRLEEIKPAYIKPFEQVEAEIAKNLKADRRRLIHEEYLLSIQKAPGIAVHQERIAELLRELQVQPIDDDSPTADEQAAAEN